MEKTESDLAQVFSKVLNDKAKRKGELTSEREGVNLKAAEKLAELWKASTDEKECIISSALTNKDTGSTGIKLLNFIGVGGQNAVFKGAIPNLEALNLKPFYVNLRKYQLHSERGGSINNVRNEYTLEAEEEADWMIKHGHLDRIKAEVIPILKSKFKGGKCAIRIGNGDKTPVDENLQRSESIDGLVNDSLIFSAARGRTVGNRQIQVVEYVDNIVDPTQIPVKFSLYDIIGMTRDCLTVLDLFERLDVVHRDIKPENILVESHKGKPLPKMADLDMMKILYKEGEFSHTATSDGIFKGTPSYYSPEHYPDPERMSIQSDVCCLGLTAYEWWTGYTAVYCSSDWLKKSQAELFLLLANEATERANPPVRPTAISRRANYGDLRWYQVLEGKKAGKIERNFEKILAGMIDKDPDRRYQHPRDVISDLDKLMKEEDIYNKANINHVFSESRRDIVR